MTHRLSALMNYGFRIERTAKKIKQNLQRQFNSANLDLTVDQWVVLDCLYQTDGVSQNELADYTFKDAPTVTRIIDLLCRKELTKRLTDEEDRRRFKICITPKGRSLVQQVLPIVHQTRLQGRNHLSEDDFTHLTRILDTIFDNFD